MRVSHLLVCCNSSANFLIYYMCGSKFRKAWNATYRPAWKKVFGLCSLDSTAPPRLQTQISIQVTGNYF